MAEDPNPEKPADWTTIGAQLAQGLMTEGVPGLLKAWQAAHIETAGQLRALDANLTIDLISFVATKWRDTEETLSPLLGALIGPIIGGLFGGNKGAADFSRRLVQGGGEGVAKSIVEGFM